MFDMDVATLLDRLPLAEAAWLLLDEVLPAAVLDDLFARHRGRGYTRAFSFADLVHLVGDALVQHQGRAAPTLRQHRGADACPASEQAFYGKLRRLPLAASEALLAEGAARLRPYLPRTPSTQLPASLDAFDVFAFDGKTFKHAAKRLKATRGKPGRALGGKALAALEVRTGLLVGMTVDPDAHRNEARLVTTLLPTLRGRRPTRRPRLWIADQQFGDLAQVNRCTQDGDHCVLRLHPKSRFEPDPTVRARRGKDRLGRQWTDAVGTLASTREGERRVRVVTLERPGKPPLALVTDLLDAAAYPANDLLELYRFRWGIDAVFLRVTETFHLQRLIGSSPQAIAFQAALCMTLYNLLQVIDARLARTQRRRPAAVSQPKVFYDLHRQMIGLHLFATPTELAAGLRRRAEGIDDFTAHLDARLAAAWTDDWIKSPKKKRNLPKARHKRGEGGHFSIHRALMQAKAEDV